MGIAMAGMLVASLTTLPNDVWDGDLRRADGMVRLARLPRMPGGQGVRALADGTARRTWCTAPRCCTCSSPSRRPPRPAGRAWRHGRRLRGGDADAEPARGGVHLRAVAGGLCGPGPGPAFRPRARPRQLLRPPGRHASRCRAGRGLSRAAGRWTWAPPRPRPHRPHLEAATHRWTGRRRPGRGSRIQAAATPAVPWAVPARSCSAPNWRRAAALRWA